jgi:hypothetical protein
MAIPKDLVEKPGPQRFTRVQGHDGTPAVFMTKKVIREEIDSRKNSAGTMS